MDDNTAEVLFFAALFGALAACYITGKITDYLQQRPRRGRGESVAPGNGSADVAALRRDLKSAEDELAVLRQQNARLREDREALGVFNRAL